MFSILFFHFWSYSPLVIGYYIVARNLHIHPNCDLSSTIDNIFIQNLVTSSKYFALHVMTTLIFVQNSVKAQFSKKLLQDSLIIVLKTKEW